MARILVGIDGSEPAKRALAFALGKAKAMGDEVVLLTVIPGAVARSSLSAMMPPGIALPEAMGKTFEANARDRLDALIAENRASGVKMSALLRTGDEAEQFVDAARETGAQEVVIGHRSFERGDVPLGAIAERLVRAMPATVTVVR